MHGGLSTKTDSLLLGLLACFTEKRESTTSLLIPMRLGSIDNRKPFMISTTLPKAPDPTDKHVGSRVKMRRLMLKMSQESLGARSGVTFQQIQKYERGINRIGASRLHTIACVLMVPETFFFEGIVPSNDSAMTSRRGGPPAFVDDFLTTREGLCLAGAFLRIKNAKLRRSIVDLVEAVAARDHQK